MKITAPPLASLQPVVRPLVLPQSNLRHDKLVESRVRSLQLRIDWGMGSKNAVGAGKSTADARGARTDGLFEDRLTLDALNCPVPNRQKVSLRGHMAIANLHTKPIHCEKR